MAAVLGLRWFRDRADPQRLGSPDFAGTAYRYLDEVIDVLADQAPDLHQALQHAHKHDMAYVILDGTVITTDRAAEKTTSVHGKTIDLWYSGRAGEHGGNIQALSAPNGFPLWVSMSNPARHTTSPPPASTRWAHSMPPPHGGCPSWPTGAYEGTGIGVHTPIKQPPDTHVLDADNRTYNALLRGLHSLGERGFALLTGRWRILQCITASPNKIGSIIQAALTLTHIEHRLT